MINVVKKELEFDDELKNKSNEINDIIDSLKPTMMNKNNFTILSDELNFVSFYFII